MKEVWAGLLRNITDFACFFVKGAVLFLGVKKQTLIEKTTPEGPGIQIVGF